MHWTCLSLVARVDVAYVGIYPEWICPLDSSWNSWVSAEPYLYDLNQFQFPGAPERRHSSMGAALVGWGCFLESQLIILLGRPDAELQEAPLPYIDRVIWLNSEASFILWVSALLLSRLLIICRVSNDVSGESHPHYKMYLKYFVESSALGTAKGFQWMSGNALNKRCYVKINCNVLCFCCLCALSCYRQEFVLFTL